MAAIKNLRWTDAATFGGHLVAIEVLFCVTSTDTLLDNVGILKNRSRLFHMPCLPKLGETVFYEGKVYRVRSIDWVIDRKDCRPVVMLEDTE